MLSSEMILRLTGILDESLKLDSPLLLNQLHQSAADSGGISRLKAGVSHTGPFASEKFWFLERIVLNSTIKTAISKSVKGW